VNLGRMSGDRQKEPPWASEKIRIKRERQRPEVRGTKERGRGAKAEVGKRVTSCRVWNNGNTTNTRQSGKQRKNTEVTKQKKGKVNCGARSRPICNTSITQVKGAGSVKHGK